MSLLKPSLSNPSLSRNNLSAVTSPLTSSSYFIADLHLDPANEQGLKLAVDFFSNIHGTHALYILGDLFEYWIGDDAGIPLYADVVQSIEALALSGCRVTFMHGNRDFLIGETLAAACHASLVCDDELMITLDDAPVLLMHGDTLCTDDTAYQGLRSQMRDKHWQSRFLAQTIDERIAYAQPLRQQSRTSSAGKTAQIMDVNELQVNERLRFNQTKTLIHGHTHKPAVHHYPDTNSQRYVLGDWHSDHAQYVVHDSHGLQLRTFTA